MVSQYPHTLRFEIVTGSTETTNDDGDTVIVPGAKTNIDIKCRFEPNSTGEFIQSADGQSLKYGWIVYMPKGSVEVPEWVIITGFDGLSEIAKGVVKRFSKGQLNSRAWV